jgi:predicted lipoprotein with Yx(FWY)xxD motif
MRPFRAMLSGSGPPRVVLLMLVISLGLVATGCGGAIPSSNGGPASVKLMSSKLGHFLVDGQGHTLYLFMGDQRGESYCTGACAAVWPPLETSSTPRAIGGISSSALGTIMRADGDRQVTYDGHPLYYYAADASTPGKTKGEALEQFGAEWYLLGSSGKPVEAESHQGSGGSNNSGGGGY